MHGPKGFGGSIKNWPWLALLGLIWTKGIWHATKRFWPWAFIAAIIFTFMTFESRMLNRAYGEPDPDGYFIMARAFATGQLGIFPTDDLLRFQDHIWVDNPRGEVVCKFAPGYPILLAITRVFFGEDAMFMLNPVLSALALVGMFKLFRFWMQPLAAVLAVAAFSVSLLFTVYTAHPLTHAADTCCIVWAMYFLWKWCQPRDGLPPGMMTTIAAGLLLGFAIVIRPMNVLLALPVGAAVLHHYFSHLRNRPVRSRPIFLLAIAYAFFPALLALYQWRMFGGPLTSGYSLGGETQAFATQYFENRMPRYLAAMRDFVGLAFIVGAVGLLLVGPACDRSLRFLWAAPPLLIHGFYYWDQPVFCWNLRLILPTLVVYYGAAFALIDQEPRRFFKAPVLLVFFVAVVMIDRGVDPDPNNRYASPVVALWKPEAAQSRNDQNARMRELIDKMPENAVVFADAPACYYLSSRKQFTAYNAFAFTWTNPDYRRGRPNRNLDWDPKQQPSRKDAVTLFYKESTREDLAEKLREHVDKPLRNGEPVRFAVWSSTVENLKEWLGPVYSWKNVPLVGPNPTNPYNRNKDLMELYEVTLTPPVIRRETIDR